MTVWLLILYVGHPASFAVPGIITKDECVRLAQELSPGIREGYYKCVPYTQGVK